MNGIDAVPRTVGAQLMLLGIAAARLGPVAEENRGQGIQTVHVGRGLGPGHNDAAHGVNCPGPQRKEAQIAVGLHIFQSTQQHAAASGV